jgi:dihydrofolate reductase
MTKVTAQLTISLDGYGAGPNQSMENPLGEGGESLHEWMVATDTWKEQHGQEGGEHSVDSDVAAEFSAGIGAYIMGRNMFGPPEGGAWDESWTGWWGDDPPYHVPTYVLTSHPRASVEMQGGTTFHFVTDGIESALEQARAAAGDQDVSIIGGANTINQYLGAGLLDELHLHISPIVLGGGARLFVDVGDLKLEPISAVHSPRATHIKYLLKR